MKDMFKHLGSLAVRHPWLTCAGWLALGLVLYLLAPSWEKGAQDDDIRFLPASCPSVRGFQLLEKAFPQDAFASRVLFAIERKSEPLSAADLALADAIADDLAKLRQQVPSLQIKKVVCRRDPFIGKRLVSDDRKCAVVQVSLGAPYLALQTKVTVDRAEEVVRTHLARFGANPPDVFTTGPSGVGRDLITASANGLENTTLATVILVVVILLVVYRSPLLALVPLATIALAVWVAISILSLCTLIPGFYLLNISQIFAIVMLYGAGTDYCLFLVSRYREELALDSNRGAALSRAVGGVAGALAASAGTVICGLGMMGLAEFAKVRCGGPAIAISLAVALAASLTITPALLRILGKAVFWPVGVPVVSRPSGEPSEGIWGWISRRVAAHPLLIGSATLLLLLPLAFLGLRVRPSYRATAELSKECSSVKGLAAIQRHFTAGEVGPVTVLLEGDVPWDSDDGRRLIGHLSKGFSLLTNVAEVRSLTQPLGRPLEEPPAPPSKPTKSIRGSLFSAVWRNVVQGYTDQVNKAARSHYLAKVPSLSGRPRYVTRLDVVLYTDPFDPRSVPALETVQLWLRDELPNMTADLGDVQAETYGVAVNARDLAVVTERDRERINLLVLGGIFVILLVLVRRPVLAAYLLATVLLSYLATLGATSLLAHWWHGRPLGEVDWRVPFFLFTILVAVGEDYNILLVSRALEERKKHGGVEGTRRALAHTGGTITSCGLIMAGTFATLVLAGLNTLVQVGFALAFGVLLDTFLVRPFLVPAFTIWSWRNERRKPVTKTRRAGQGAALSHVSRRSA
jgi:RND superfamily putative drug exporter